MRFTYNVLHYVTLVSVCAVGLVKKIFKAAEHRFAKAKKNKHGLEYYTDGKGKVWTMFAKGKVIGNPCQPGFRLEFDKPYLGLFGKSLQKNKQKNCSVNPV